MKRIILTSPDRRNNTLELSLLPPDTWTDHEAEPHSSFASRGGNPETCDARNASKVVMMLQRFLALTADVPATSLRAAMAKAIAEEPPSRSYQRFYCRVLCEVGIQACQGDLAA